MPGQSSYILENKQGKHLRGYCDTCGLALDKHGKALNAWPLNRGEKRCACKAYGSAVADLLNAI